jgi:hypothetical protein
LLEGIKLERSSLVARIRRRYRQPDNGQCREKCNGPCLSLVLSSENRALSLRLR